jgi:hypothetical protein
VSVFQVVFDVCLPAKWHACLAVPAASESLPACRTQTSFDTGWGQSKSGLGLIQAFNFITLEVRGGLKLVSVTVNSDTMLCLT